MKDEGEVLSVPSTSLTEDIQQAKRGAAMNATDQWISEKLASGTDVTDDEFRETCKSFCEYFPERKKSVAQELGLVSIQGVDYLFKWGGRFGLRCTLPINPQFRIFVLQLMAQALKG